MPKRYHEQMELRQLRYFVQVAEESSFTKAGQKLRVAQPALIRQIRQLENELGVTLLERDRRGVRLTAVGGAFLAEAQNVLAQSARAIQVAQGKSIERRVLNIGYVWGLFHTMVPSLVTKFHGTHPDIAVNLFDLTATQQAEALMKGELDAGFIGFSREADAAGLSKQKVGACNLVAALPKNHRATQKKSVKLETLAKEFFIVISEDNYPGALQWMLAACDEAGFKPRILQAAGRGHTILSLVAGNRGVALLPEPLRALPHPGVVFRRLADATANDLFVAWNGKQTSPIRDLFLAAQ